MFKLVWSKEYQEFRAVDRWEFLNRGEVRYPLSIGGETKEEVLEQAEELAEYLRNVIYKELDENE